MKVSITHETDTHSGVADLVRMLQVEGFEDGFSESEYGAGIHRLCCAVRCLPHSYQRQGPKMLNGTIFVPVDLDYDELGALPQPQRKKAIGTRLNDKVRQALARLPLPATFDAARFLGEQKTFLRRKGWL